MNGKDRRPEPEWPIRAGQAQQGRAQHGGADPRKASRKGINPVFIALGGLLVLLLIIWFFSGNRSPDQDKLTGIEPNAESEAGAGERCATRATYDLIKRDLFRRAAEMRGSDRAAFDQLASVAVVRMENAVFESEDEETGAINCSGSLSLDLPPGVAVVGGRRTLTANIDYTLQRAASGDGDVLLLRNAETIVTPLATLARLQTADPTATPATDPLAPLDGPAPGATAAAPGATQPSTPGDPPASSSRPSFDCDRARTAGEVAVCRSPGLASLDREMSGQFAGAMAQADGEERALLQRTRNRFLSYRDSCRSDACIADAYRGRMREIRDIMAGNWSPN